MATVAIQLFLLNEAVDLMTPEAAAHIAVMRTGLTRIILFDRLLPPATVLLAMPLVGMVAVWSMELESRDKKSAARVLLVGLVPLLALRIGELGATVLAVSSFPGVGEVIVLPRRFFLGPRLLGGPDPDPWVHGLDARFNLVTIWVMAIWSHGLGRLGGGGFRWWARGVVLACFCIAALVTWSWGGTFVELILRGW